MYYLKQRCQLDRQQQTSLKIFIEIKAFLFTIFISNVVYEKTQPFLLGLHVLLSSVQKCNDREHSRAGMDVYAEYKKTWYVLAVYTAIINPIIHSNGWQSYAQCSN